MKTLLFILSLLFVTAMEAQATPVLVQSGMDGAKALAEARRVIDADELVLAGGLADALGEEAATLVVLGAPTLKCHSGVDTDLERSLFAVRNLVDEMDYGRARAAIEVVVGGLPCIAETVDTEALFDLYLLGGIAAFYEDERERALDFFSRAAALDPSRPWPSEYPPAPKVSYLEAFKNALASPPANLRSMLPGKLRLDGTPWAGEPRLYVGSHILWIEDLGVGVGIEVPPRSDLPNGEVVVTSGALLEQGLLAGEMAYEPRMKQLADSSGWDRVVLVSDEGVLDYQDRTFVLPPKLHAELARAAKRAAGPSPLTMGGIGMAIAGGSLAGVGVAVHLQAAGEGRIRVGEPLKTADQYSALQTRNRAGLGMAVAGGATAVAGITLAIIGAAQRAKQREQTVVLAPWFIATGKGGAVGISGRLP